VNVSQKSELSSTSLSEKLTKGEPERLESLLILVYLLFYAPRVSSLRLIINEIKRYRNLPAEM